MALEVNSESVEYKNNKVIIKSLPTKGDNLSVFVRPGDEIVFEIEGITPEQLEYLLIGGGYCCFLSRRRCFNICFFRAYGI